MTHAPRKINHIGLAVADIEAFLRKTTPRDSTVELLEPLGEGSPLQAFLNRNRRGGLIHLALEVSDLDAAIAG